MKKILLGALVFVGMSGFALAQDHHRPPVHRPVHRPVHHHHPVHHHPVHHPAHRPLPVHH